MTDTVELPDPGEASTDGFARWIAIGAVLATLAAASVGYLQSQASKADAQADFEAQQLAVQAFGDLSRRREQAQVQYERFVLGQDQLRRASTALEEQLFGDTERGRELTLERTRWERLAEGTERSARRYAAAGGPPPIARDGPDGPDQDPIFPGRYFSRSQEEGIRLGALRDAANEESAERAGQVASYVVMLAMLAVAVYLFGFALTPHGRPNRRLFAGVAAGLTAVAIIWAVFVGLSSPRRAPDEAATAYVAGSIAAGTEEWDRAVREYTRAIELRPTFALAYVGRADAEFSQGSPQSSGFKSLTRTEFLERAVADQRKALELGSTDAGLLGGTAFNLMTIGFRSGSDDMVEEGMELSERAEAADPGEAGVTFNTALGQLYLEQPEEAARTYREAIEKTIYLDPQRRRKRSNPVVEEGYVAGALTDLELVDRATEGRLEQEVDRIKASIVRSVQSGRVLDVPRPRAKARRGLEAVLTPATAQFTFPSGTFDAARERISAQWYRKEGDLGWAALPEVSGPVQDYEQTEGKGGQTFVRRPYLAATAPATCLTTGEYRVELYVDGRLAAEARSDPKDDLADLEAGTDSDVGFALCHPRGWQPAEGERPGLINGYVNRDSTKGVYVTRVAAGEGEGGRSPEQRGLRKLETVLGLLLPDAKFKRGPEQDVAFLGLEGETVRTFTYNDGGGEVLAGYGFDPDGALFAGIVFGPPDYGDTNEGSELFNSITQR